MSLALLMSGIRAADVEMYTPDWPTDKKANGNCI